MNDTSLDKELKSVRTIERVLDRAFVLPGGFSFGLDGIVGLIPVVGDLTTTGVSSFLVYKAVKLGLPKRVIAKMVVNLIIDTVIGSIPVVGDVFDFFYKSNVKNLQLIQRHANEIHADKLASDFDR